MKDQDQFVGWCETVSLPELGVHNVVAKMDTGAFSGALHCKDIKVVRRGELRKRVLKYVPLGKSKLAQETDEFIEKYVRSSTGHRLKRYIIRTTIEIKGKNYPIDIGLSDRSDMKKEVLIGRRFLREHGFLVNVRLNQQYDDEGESTR